MENNRINPGELDTKITVQSVSQTRGGEGQKSRAFVTYGDVWAKVEPLTDESVSDDNFEAVTTVSVTLYKIPALTSRWRLLISGVPYEIVSIDPISRWSAFNVLTARTIQK